jgi:hypothetical protein
MRDAAKGKLKLCGATLRLVHAQKRVTRRQTQR